MGNNPSNKMIVEQVFLKTACSRCGGGIEFAEEQIGAAADCPHCAASLLLDGRRKQHESQPARPARAGGKRPAFGLVPVLSAFILFSGAVILLAAWLLERHGLDERDVQALRKILVRIQVQAESGVSHYDLVRLHREAAEATRASRKPDKAGKIMGGVVRNLEFAVFFSKSRYKYVRDEDEAMLRRAGLMSDPKVWRITETRDWMEDNYDSIWVYSQSAKLNPERKAWYNQRHALITVLEWLHEDAGYALKKL